MTDERQDRDGSDGTSLPARSGSGMFRSTFAIAFFTFLSRIAGFFRDVLMTAILGTGAGADAFFIAMRIANLGRSLFAEGAINAVFVPMFSRRLVQSGRSEAYAFVSTVLNWLLAVLLGISILIELLMPLIVVLFAPGFGEIPGKIEQTTLFSRVAFPYLLLISLVTLLSGALNSLGRFWVGAAVPILLNAVMILTLLLALPYSGNPGLWLSWSLPIAGILQLIALIVAASRAGVTWRVRLPGPDPELRKLLRLFLPVALAGLIGWGTLIVTSALASFQESAVSYLQYAERLYFLPLSLIGVSIGVVLLPELSRQLRNSENERAIVSQNRALEFALLLTMPAMVILFLLPDPIINVLFERGRFTAEDTRATATALSVLSVGLPGAVLMHIFVTVFYARQDTRTPLIYGALANGIYILAAFGFFQWLGYVGIALAASVAAWSNAAMLGLSLYNGGKLFFDPRLLRRMIGLFVSTTVMFMIVWSLHQGGGIEPMASKMGGGLTARTSVLVLLIGAGTFAYALTCQLSGAVHWRELLVLALPGRGSKQEKS